MSNTNSGSDRDDRNDSPQNMRLPNLRRHAALEELTASKLFHSIRWLNSTDSTNRQLASEIKSRQAIAPALLVTDQQSGGKGRGGNQWFSPAGCLMFSIAVPLGDILLDVTSDRSTLEQDCSRLDTNLQDRLDQVNDNHRLNNLLPLEVGIVVAQTISHFSRYRPQVKWPNDVYIQNKKVCGILIEVVQPLESPTEDGVVTNNTRSSTTSNPVSDPSLQNASSESNYFNQGPVAIIGIGINCQVNFQAAAPDVQKRATSLHLVSNQTGDECSPEDVLIHFVQLWKNYLESKVSDENWLFSQWKQWSFLEGKWVRIDRANSSSDSQPSKPNSLGQIEGMCLGIDSNGSLLVATTNGGVVPVIAGTVSEYRDA